MKKNQNLILFAIITLISFNCFNVAAQTFVKQVILVNGGQFEFAPPYMDYVTVNSYDPATKQTQLVDTIFTQSAQDILIDGEYAYIAAADSIIKYNLSTLERSAAVAFGASSTIKLAIYNSSLLVGNWFGSSDNNLRIFNKNDLSYMDSIPEITKGAKDMIIVGDTAYIQQNHTNSSFSDSAGYLAVVDLSNMTYVRDVLFSNKDEELGRLQVSGNTIYAMNASSNTISTYDISNGTSSTVSFPLDIQVGPYGQQSFLFHDTLFFKFNDGIGSYNIKTGQIIDTTVLDSSVAAFSMDTINHLFYVTQTDFATYTRGGIYSRSGDYIDSLSVGFSPEALAIDYDIPSGIERISSVDFINVFPNPTTSEVFIDPSNDSETYHLNVFSITGSQLYAKRNLVGRHRLELYDYTSGIYLIEVTMNGKSMRTKLIKQ